MYGGWGVLSLWESEWSRPPPLQLLGTRSPPLLCAHQVHGGNRACLKVVGWPPMSPGTPPSLTPHLRTRTPLHSPHLVPQRLIEELEDVRRSVQDAQSNARVDSQALVETDEELTRVGDVFDRLKVELEEARARREELQARVEPLRAAASRRRAATKALHAQVNDLTVRRLSPKGGGGGGGGGVWCVSPWSAACPTPRCGTIRMDHHRMDHHGTWRDLGRDLGRVCVCGGGGGFRPSWRRRTASCRRSGRRCRPRKPTGGISSIN